MNFLKNVLMIPSATPDERDAAQYMFRHGRKQVNLCGEMCVACVTQDESHSGNIDDFLDYWQAKDLKWYQAVFKNGLARTTGVYDLEKMLSAYGYPPSIPFHHVPSAPFAMKISLETRRAIVGVNIDYTGYLVGRGIPHWVVLEEIEIIDSNHAIVKIYNPFTNNQEPYSWREFMNSTGAYKNGVWIGR